MQQPARNEEEPDLSISLSTELAESVRVTTIWSGANSEGAQIAPGGLCFAPSRGGALLVAEHRHHKDFTELHRIRCLFPAPNEKWRNEFTQSMKSALTDLIPIQPLISLIIEFAVANSMSLPVIVPV